jgi:hypothetical protein
MGIQWNHLNLSIFDYGFFQGLMARAKETILTLVLLSLIILGMMYVVAALIDRDRDSIDRIFRKSTRSFS